ncbi:MAG TPA: hypothetical protein VGG71_14850, partial [Chitinophagaceae bacterium]
MLINVVRRNVLFHPDSSRVIARFLYSTDERSAELIVRILSLSEKQQQEILTQVLRDYSKRHRSISKIFEKNFARVIPLFSKFGISLHSLSTSQKVLIGSYFTM